MNSTPLPIGNWRIVWRRFKQHRVAYVGFFFFVFLLLLVIAGPHLLPYELDQVSLGERMHGPSTKHWFGTDELGRDTWVRIMHGGRVSLAVGLIVGLSTVILGGLIGILAGYIGGALDNILMRMVDTIYTIPRIVRATTTAPVDPTSVPMTAVVMPSPTTWRRIRGRSAPSAIRNPISWLRCETTNDITP